jgi:hypothetical protein
MVAQSGVRSDVGRILISECQRCGRNRDTLNY